MESSNPDGEPPYGQPQSNPLLNPDALPFDETDVKLFEENSSLNHDLPGANVVNVNRQSFRSEVLESELPVVVDFYANWCAPCRRLSPILDRMAARFAGQIKFVKINSDQQNELAAEYQVNSLPTVVMIDQGEKIGQFAGLPDEKDLQAALKKWVETRSTTA